MSTEVDQDTTIAVADDGISVKKSFEADEFPVPAIQFVVSSDHDEPVTVRLREDIPEEFPMDGVGFHPDFDSDNWTAFQDHHVEYERTLEPGESVTTVYGIRIDEESEATAFLSEPQVTEVGDDDEAGEEDRSEVENDNTIDDIVVNDSNQVVKDMLSGEGDMPGLDEDEAEAEADSDDVGSIDLDLGIDDDSVAEDDAGAEAEDGEAEDPEIELDLDAAEEQVEAEDGDEDDEADEPEIELDLESAIEDDEESEASVASEPEDDEETTDAAESEPEAATEDDDASAEESMTAPVENVAAALAEELREGTVAEEDVEALRAELDLEPSGVDVAKVEHLQSRVEEVAAYSEALTEFLDDKGTAQQLIEDYEAEVDDLRDELAELSETVDDHDDELTDLNESLDETQDGVDQLESRVDDIDEEVSEIQSWRDQLGSMFN